MKMKIFREYIITSLAVSMLIVFWMFFIDAFFYNMWSNFRIIISIVSFAFLLCLIHTAVNFLLDNKPIISIILEYAIVVIMFFVFGIKFKWYPAGSEWLVFIYTIPVYGAGYLLRLVGVRKDADYINIRLSERKKRKTEKIEIKKL
ncbi:hypothetical protein [Clostridium sp. C2-6-12]|uniref:hypothetical protein n=1 Tax=Clostridium sp. C2-6-12 TaxID=2698832 RepID=UPI001FAD95BA|nr:hypothetical protein [Clostridium sp. C2-6-12]